MEEGRESSWLGEAHLGWRVEEREKGKIHKWMRVINRGPIPGTALTGCDGDRLGLADVVSSTTRPAGGNNYWVPRDRIAAMSIA